MSKSPYVVDTDRMSSTQAMALRALDRLATGYDDLLLSKLTNGTGTAEPHGILDTLVEQTTTETTVTTEARSGKRTSTKSGRRSPRSTAVARAG